MLFFCDDERKDYELRLLKQRAEAILLKTDWTQLSDAPLTPEEKAMWSDFRQGWRRILDAQVFEGVAIPTEPKTSANTLAKLTAAVQAHLDRTAAERGYTDAERCVSYERSTVTAWAAEGASMNAWRDAVWLACNQVMADVQAGKRAIPTVEELIADLPKIKW